MANHTHTWKQKSDTNAHWKECDCGERTEIEEHHFEQVTDKATGKTYQVCKDCGYRKAGGDSTSKSTEEKVTKPAKVKKLKLKAGKATLTVSWAKASGIKGYEVQYSRKKSMKAAKKKKLSAKKTSVKLKKLKRKKTYYVRIRAYRMQNGKPVYSAWSAKKAKKVK